MLYQPQIGVVMIAWIDRVFREANGDYIIREVFYSDA